MFNLPSWAWNHWGVEKLSDLFINAAFFLPLTETEPKRYRERERERQTSLSFHIQCSNSKGCVKKNRCDDATIRIYLLCLYWWLCSLQEINRSVWFLFFLHHNWPSNPNHRTKSFSFATTTDSKLRSDKKTKNKNGVCVCFTCSQQCCYLPSRPLLFQ